MAHSTPIAAAAALTKGEINYFYKDKNGQIHKVIKPAAPIEIKQEAIGGGGAGVGATHVYSGGSVGGVTTNRADIAAATNMNVYNQMNTSSSSNQPQFVRIPSTYNLSTGNNAGYSVMTQHGNGNGNNNGNGNGNGNIQQSQNHGTGTLQQQQQQQQYETTNNEYHRHSGSTGGGGGGGDYAPIVKHSSRYNTKYSQQQQQHKQQNQTHLQNAKNKSKLHVTNSTSASVQKKRKPEKAGKGLRHFSMKVCEKVKEKGTTTYNEVADELVHEELQHNSLNSVNCDQKNIRRRVYDALNVLMAMKIISKDKKEIRWIGLPSNSVEQCSAIEKENEEKRERIKQKHQQLRELLLQQVSFKSLIERNKTAERQGIVPTPNSSIQLPFIIVNTHKSTKINCSVTNDKSEYFFKFDDKFEMHDDAEVLKKMGLLYGLDKGQCSQEDIDRAKTLVPPNFEKYIDAYGNGKGVTCDSDDDLPSYMEYTNDSQGFHNHHHRTDGMASPELDDEEFQNISDIDD